MNGRISVLFLRLKNDWFYFLEMEPSIFHFCRDDYPNGIGIQDRLKFLVNLNGMVRGMPPNYLSPNPETGRVHEFEINSIFVSFPHANR